MWLNVEMIQKSQNPIRIRKFKKEDAKKVSSLIKKTLIEVNSKDYPQKVIQFLCRNNAPKKLIQKSSNRLIYVAVEDEQILGTVSLKDDTILGLFVNPRFHSLDIGTNLMKYVETVANKEGFKSVCLPSSITAYGFYEKIGYKKVRDVYSKEYGKVIVMEKSLFLSE